MFAASWRKSGSRRKRCTAGWDILLRKKQKHEKISTQRLPRTQSSPRSAGIFSASAGVYRALFARLFFLPMSTNRIRTVLEMIKFEHSVFALPFALTGALLAARATGNGHSVFLFLHEALHQLVASFSRVCAGHLACRRLDCHHRRP